VRGFATLERSLQEDTSSFTFMVFSPATFAVWMAGEQALMQLFDLFFENLQKCWIRMMGILTDRDLSDRLDLPLLRLNL
jgi:hypothetical protein